MHILIALIAIVIGAILSIVGLPFLGAPTLIGGVILFTCGFDTVDRVDYCTYEDGHYIHTTRQHRYAVPYIFFGLVRILYKVSYMKIVLDDLEADSIPDECVHFLSAKEYRDLVARQRQQYLDGTVSPKLVEMVCHPQKVCFERQKFLYILCWVLFILFTTVFTVPSAILFAVVCCGLMGWLVYLRGKEYKEAKVKRLVHNRYFLKQ